MPLLRSSCLVFCHCILAVPAALMESQLQVLGSFVRSTVQTMVCAFQEPAFGRSFPLAWAWPWLRDTEFWEAEKWQRTSSRVT